MRESTDRVQHAVNSRNAQEQLVAARILEHPDAWQHWEQEHAALMREVAEVRDSGRQTAALKQTAFTLIHRKALFEFLRDGGVRGGARTRVLAHFRTGQHSKDAVIAEHKVYLRRACSYLCAGHIGVQVLEDAGFVDPFRRYEELYAEYFDLYCRAVCGVGVVAPEKEENDLPQMQLLPLLKLRLKEWRHAILNPSEALPRLMLDAELRRPTGDTVRQLGLHSRFAGRG
jgi:hypothetical protein